jgi:hypothetical protein
LVAYLFWVQKVVGSNPATLKKERTPLHRGYKKVPRRYQEGTVL